MPYSSEEDALEDVLRLSKGMTYKAAVSGLNLGGGKAVIIGDPEKDKAKLFLEAMVDLLNRLMADTSLLKMLTLALVTLIIFTLKQITLLGLILLMVVQVILVPGLH